MSFSHQKLSGMGDEKDQAVWYGRISKVQVIQVGIAPSISKNALCKKIITPVFGKYCIF